MSQICIARVFHAGHLFIGMAFVIAVLINTFAPTCPLPLRIVAEVLGGFAITYRHFAKPDPARAREV